MKKKGSTIILILIFIAGLGILAYPKVSDYWNSIHSSRAIMSYAEAVSGLSEEEYDRLYQEAEAYNRRIPERSNPFVPTEEEKAEYETILNVENDGVMGYIEIPLINVALPIYHGTSESVLQVAIGHLDWTSLPVGGESSHAVISGHRGLPSAELFTRLDRLAKGDRFMIYVLNEVLTYEVDQILIVLPEDVSALQIIPGQDYCTLVTCTPYGINTHRILVRGRRVETETEHTVRVTSEAIQIEPVLVAPVIALPLLMVLFAVVSASDRRQWDEKLEHEEDSE
ncbi:class C sortase [Oscillospiraceae bacterium 44-34]